MFKDLKVTYVKTEGKRIRTEPGDLLNIKNAKLEVPVGQSIRILAPGNILQPVTVSIMQSENCEGMPDIMDQWQCPDPPVKVVFGIE
jgi:archaellum component FlaG (FlaF/FlaG flagellin family)